MNHLTLLTALLAGFGLLPGVALSASLIHAARGMDAPSDWSPVEEDAADFASARECRPIDGRKVWVGEKGYYIQSWMFNHPGPVDPDGAVGSVYFKENTPEALEPFELACQ